MRPLLRLSVCCSIPLLQLLACSGQASDGAPPDETPPASEAEPTPESGDHHAEPGLAQPELAPPIHTLVDTSALSKCSAGLTEAELDEQLRIAVALHDSVHQLVACGGMTITVAATLVSGIAGAILDATTSFGPKGLRYDGEGRYVAATGAWSQGTLTIRLWMDGPDGPALIEDDLFALKAYLKGARVSSGLDGTTPWAEVTFSEPGPWVELLGLGANPSSPIRLRGNELLSFSPKLDGVLVSSDILVDDGALDSVITYSVSSEPVALSELLETGNIPYELLGIAAENPKTGQHAVTDDLDWDIAFGQAALTGSASFRIEGEVLDYALYYGHSPDHSDDIVASCLD